MYANLTDDGRTHRTYSDDGLPWQNRRTTFWGFVISLTVIAWLSVGLRLHARIFRFRCPGWDDVIIFAALVTATISAICLCISEDYGLGQRSTDVFAADKIMFFKLFWIANAVFTMSNALVKLSLLAQYLRVFEAPYMRLICKILICLIATWGSIYSFIAWFPCFPPSSFWNFTINSVCYGYGSPDPLHVYQTTVSATASNMAFDIVTWALPIHLLGDKGIERRTKRALGCLLVLGLVILGVAAGRCLANGSTAEAHPDPFWNFPIIVLLGESENRLACILGSIPIFWPVVERAAERLQDLYRIFVTEEFVVGSSRALPGEVVFADASYEAPEWVEQQDEAGQSTYGKSEGRGEGSVPNTSDLCLPQWPESTAGSIGSSEASEDVQEKPGPGDNNV